MGYGVNDRQIRFIDRNKHQFPPSKFLLHGHAGQDGNSEPISYHLPSDGKAVYLERILQSNTPMEPNAFDFAVNPMCRVWKEEGKVDKLAQSDRAGYLGQR